MSNQHSSAFKTKNDVLIETLLKDILNKIKEYTKDDIEVVEESENSFDVDALYSEFERVLKKVCQTKILILRKKRHR